MVTSSSQSKKSKSSPLNSTKFKKVHAEQFWRSFYYFNSYRLIIAIGIAIASWLFNLASLGIYNRELFDYSLSGYLAICCLSFPFLKIRKPNFDCQLSFQISSDVIFICLMVYASGGIQSGLGALLLVSLAGAGLISWGRLALFFASLASIGMLLQETYAFLYVDGYQAQYTQVGLLCMGYFAIAWLAHRLSTHAIINEQLAQQRGTDLADMSQVNQLVIQDMQDGVLVISCDGEIRQHNISAKKLIGIPSSSNTPNPLILVDYAPTLANRLASWHDNANTSFDLLRLPTSNALVRTRFVPIKAERQTGVVIFLEDMERIQAQAQQLKLAALGRLTANIAHEIRNPLSAISHAAELLGEQQNPNPADTRLVRIIHNNTQRLNQIVEDVLQLNKRDITQQKPLDINSFINNFIDEFCHAEKIHHDIFKLYVTESKIIIFDNNQLNQILWNLCRNAWRHCCKKNGSIQLMLTDNEQENWFNIDVIDDGPGISPEQIKHIFEPFVTTESSGTGLGLYIAREMCEVNHASLNYLKNDTGGHFRIICKKK